ncbi:MAG: hypothetical protein AMXMBFR58_12190 [Phycisphaerae bacterium]|nr:hypothetical protein [Phycisphaerales bacterium]
MRRVAAFCCAFVLIGSAGSVADAACGTCRADFDGSGFVDTDDFDAFVAAFEEGTAAADFDGTGFVDTDDIDAFVCSYVTGCGLDFNSNGKADCLDYQVYMDAFETQQPLADFNCDGTIDASDAAAFTAQYEKELLEFSCDSTTTCKDLDSYILHWGNGLVTADMNCDGSVRSDDFNMFIEAWTLARLDADGSGIIDCGDAELFAAWVAAKKSESDFNCDGAVNSNDLQGYMYQFKQHCDTCNC